MAGNFDFNTAERQGVPLIPAGTLVKVRLAIKPGNHNDQALGCYNGLATMGDNSGSVYLNCDFTVLEGPFANRKIFDMIGIMSPKGPKWGEMGRAMIRAIIESSRNVLPKDTSPEANTKRIIGGYQDLEGMEFVAKVGVREETANFDAQNNIKAIITPEHAHYRRFMFEGGETVAERHGVPAAPTGQTAPAGYAPQAAPPTAPHAYQPSAAPQAQAASQADDVPFPPAAAPQASVPQAPANGSAPQRPSYLQ